MEDQQQKHFVQKISKNLKIVVNHIKIGFSFKQYYESVVLAVEYIL